MRVTATPGEVARWASELASLPDDRRRAVIRWCSEVFADCGCRAEPIRRVDSRGNIVGRLVHLGCIPRSDLTDAQRDALGDREAA